MASLCIESKDDAQLQMNRICDSVKEMKEETGVLFEQMEALGNEISAGLQGFVPKLKEMLPIMDQTVEAAEQANRTLRDLIEKDDKINSIKDANLD